MNKTLRDLFNFTSRERNGILVLLVILFGISAIKFWIVFRKPADLIFDHTDIASRIDSFIIQTQINDETQEYSPIAFLEDLSDTSQLFCFDPNTIPENGLLQLGIEKRVVNTLLNYRKKGGKFQDPKDLKKIYGMTDVEYSRLEPYIRIKQKEVATTTTGRTTPVISDVKINLNASDTSDLMQIKGIGPVLSNRIIKYRALLGGYCHATQLTEVYGISDSLFAAIRYHLYADTAGIKKINVNQASEYILSRHPYIGNYYAKGIIQYRQYVKEITGIEELFYNNLLPEDKKEILAFYLTY